MGDQRCAVMLIPASSVRFLIDLAWLLVGLIPAASDSESAVLPWPRCRLSP